MCGTRTAADEVHFNTPLRFFQNRAGDNEANAGMNHTLDAGLIIRPGGLQSSTVLTELWLLPD